MTSEAQSDWLVELSQARGAVGHYSPFTSFLADAALFFLQCFLEVVSEIFIAKAKQPMKMLTGPDDIIFMFKIKFKGK